MVPDFVVMSLILNSIKCNMNMYINVLLEFIYIENAEQQQQRMNEK